MPFPIERLALRIVATALLLVSIASTDLRAQRSSGADPERELQRRADVMKGSLERATRQEREEDVEGRDEWFNFQRRFPYAMIPAGTRARGIEAMRVMEERGARAKGANSLLSASSWQPAGPANVGGRVRAIAQHPAKPGVYFIGAAAGGVWKTEDNGVTWTTTFDKESAMAIGALAIDYSNPSVIYAGTGEYTVNTDSYLGNGIFKSTNEGASWTNIGLTNVSSFSALGVHRQNPEIVYALGAKGGGGFYRSTDAGGTWTLIQALYGFSMSVNPRNSDQVLISTSSSILRSTDAGVNWTTARGINSGGLRRISVSFAPSNPSIAYALCARGTGNGDVAMMYRSSDGGANWTQTAEIPTYFFRDQGWYDNCIAVHPDSPSVVLAGGIDIFRTDDNGVTWANYTDSYGGALGDYNDDSWVHPDQHVIEFSPTTPGQVLIGNDGGVHISPDAGIHWRRLSMNLPITQFYRIDVDPFDPRRVFGGTQDNGSLGTVPTVPGTWKSVSGGDGFWVAVDPFDPTIVYTELYYAQAIYRVNTATNDVRPIHFPINEIGGERGDWSTPLACSPYDARLYSARVNIYRTSNQGSTWERLSTGASAFISAIALSYQDGNHMLIGTTNGEIRVSKDDGKTWTRAKGVPARYVTDIKFDPNSADRIYATVSGTGAGHVFRSDDGGLNFINLTSNLPDVPTNTVAVDPDAISHIFVGTDVGVFMSLDGGQIWSPFNSGLPYAPVVDLRVAYGARTLIAATHGRSAFSIDITNVQPEPVMIAPQGGETFAAPARISAQWAGLEGPIRLRFSLDGGGSWETVAENVVGSSASFDVGLIRTTTGRVEAEEQEGAKRVVRSGLFSILANANGSEMGTRNLVAEAIEVRDGTLWATARGTDSLFVYRLPLLSGRTPVERIGIEGHVRDLAYDPVRDHFYVLTAEDDFSNARLWEMDTTGAGVREIPLPERTVRGVASVPNGIAISPVGDLPEVIVLDTVGAEVERFGPGEISSDAARRSLAWDGDAFVQGAMDTSASGYAYSSYLERLHPRPQFRITQRTPTIVPGFSSLAIVGLAYSPDTTGGVRGVYFATDTAGKFFRFVVDNVFSGVDSPTGSGVTRENATLDAIHPNPVHQRTDVVWTLKRATSIDVALFSPDGKRIVELFSGQHPAGEGRGTLSTASIASGIYYLAITTTEGDRVVRPVIVAK